MRGRGTVLKKGFPSLPGTFNIFPRYGGLGGDYRPPTGSGAAPRNLAPPFLSMDNILSVRELTERLRRTVEQRFPFVWVRGETTNLSRPSSGHIYFSLKEGDDLLNCVWFRGRQREQERFDPLTGEVWEDGPRPSLAATLVNGQAIICAGRLSVYGPRGGYQLIVELAQEEGQGRLAAALEELKRKLAALGYFDQSRKRPLPEHPARVALITAPTGAAVRDFIRISSDRGLGSAIRIYPSPVQGDEAPPRLVEAIEQANAEGWAELIVLIRGGGSLQDLWAFNDERVAHALFASRLPVLTGVGHEIDHSIADFVADRSAATPSHAAQLLWPERSVYVQRVDDAEALLEDAMQRQFTRLARNLDQELRALTLLSPSTRLQRQTERLDDAARRLDEAWNSRLAERRRTMEREYERLIRYGSNAPLDARLRDTEALAARLDLAAEAAFSRAQGGTENLLDRLDRLSSSLFTEHRHALERLALKLEGLNPRAPLERGYALARTRDGHVVKSIHELAPGRRILVEVRDGIAESEVVTLLPAQN